MNNKKLSEKYKRERVEKKQIALLMNAVQGMTEENAIQLVKQLNEMIDYLMDKKTPIGTRVEITKMLYFEAVLIPEKKMLLNGEEIVIEAHRNVKLKKYKHRKN